MKKIFLFTIFVLFTIVVFSQVKSYEIKVKINGIHDTVIYLGHHFGEKKYVVDTARVDSKGNAVFKKNRFLHKGIYLIIMPSMGMNYFEILVSNQKNFSLEADTSNFVETIKFKSCKENVVFNEYQKKMGRMQDERQKLNKEYEAAKDDEALRKKVVDKMTEQNTQRIAFMNKLISDNKGTFFSKILLSMIDIDIPDAPKDDKGEVIDPQFQYRFYKKHYFDNIDFSESGLLRTPILEGKINYYFEKMVIPTPDSIIPEVKILIQDIYNAGDTLMFQYICSHLLNYFETSKVMGYDAVFVSIAEDWYLSGKAKWADKEFLGKLSERVEKITPNKLGNIAPDLKRMQSFDEKYISLHQVVADYTILVFYEPHCGHCKKEIPALMEEFRDTLKSINVSVFAVYTQYDHAEWKAFIDEKNLQEKSWYNVWDGPYPHSKFRDYYDIYSTPVIFVLDKDKKIIGKRIGVENIKDLINFENTKQHKQNK